jgi:hypothetical protein
MGGIGSYFTQRHQAAQQSLPANLQSPEDTTQQPAAASQQLVAAPQQPAAASQQLVAAPQQPAAAPQQAYSYGRSAWPGSGYGGMPGRFGAGMGGGFQGGGYGGMYGGGGYGYGGSPFGYGPGSYNPYSAGSMGYGGGSGMYGQARPMSPFGGFQNMQGGYEGLLQSLMGGAPQQQPTPYQPVGATTGTAMNPTPAPAPAPARPQRWWQEDRENNRGAR